MWGISYWSVPIFSSLVWLAMLIAMIATWATQGYPHYASMDQKQTIAYISDVGAQGLKPLFIAMSAVAVVSFDVAFVLERWLRHTGRLTQNTSWFQKICSFISIIAAIAGAAGLILLSIFDTLRHHNLHDGFLVLFIGGYIVSAIFICWEYQRLGIYFRETSVLRYSFWIKLSFILAEVALAIAFGVCQKVGKYDAAAVLEWVIAFVFFFYVLSFFIDFMPAVRTKNHQSSETEMDVALESGNIATNGGHHHSHSRSQTNGYTNGNYTSGNGLYPGSPNGGANNTHFGSHTVKPQTPVPASQNF